MECRFIVSRESHFTGRKADTAWYQHERMISPQRSRLSDTRAIEREVTFPLANYASSLSEKPSLNRTRGQPQQEHLSRQLVLPLTDLTCLRRPSVTISLTSIRRQTWQEYP